MLLCGNFLCILTTTNTLTQQALNLNVAMEPLGCLACPQACTTINHHLRMKTYYPGEQSGQNKSGKKNAKAWSQSHNQYINTAIMDLEINNGTIGLLVKIHLLSVMFNLLR